MTKSARKPSIAKVFRSGNSIAVRMPKELGLEPDSEFLVERSGDIVTLVPKQALTPAELVEELRAIGAPKTRLKRQKIVFPKQPGL